MENLRLLRVFSLKKGQEIEDMGLQGYLNTTKLLIDAQLVVRSQLLIGMKSIA